MLLYVYVFGLSQLILGVLTEKENPFHLDFHQNDYKVKFEWLEVGHFNNRLMTTFETHFFKYNRTCAAANLTFEHKFHAGNDVALIFQAYKFASNEYRLFPLRFQINFCEGLRKNYAGALRGLNCGNFTGCPLEKGVRTHICNWTPDETELPPFIPSGRYKLEVQGTYYGQELWLLNAFGEIFRPIVRK